MEYDIATKVVLSHAKEAVVRWFLGMEPEHIELLEELPQETVSLRRSDFPLRIRTSDGVERLVVLEVQTSWKWDVPLRLAEYVIRFCLQYRLPTRGAILLLKPHEGLDEVYEMEGLRFNYRLIRVWEMAASEILERAEIGLYPFVPLMVCEDRDVLKSEQGIYASSLSRGTKADLLTSLTIFAGLKNETLAQQLLMQRRDIMRESAAYALIKEEGHQEGLQQGIQQGIQQGMLEDAREMLLRAIQARFDVIPAETEAQVGRITSRFTLGSLLEQAIRSENLEAFQESLQQALKRAS